MIQTALLAIPGIGPFLATAWTVIASPTGRKIAFCFALAFGSFYAGWHIKANIDDAATARAVIAKQRIDLEAAKDTAEQASAVVAQLSESDRENQETIRVLQDQVSKRLAACTLDDPTASGLRRLR